MAIIKDIQKFKAAEQYNELYERCIGQSTNLKEMLAKLEVLKNDIENDAKVYSVEDKAEVQALHADLLSKL